MDNKIIDDKVASLLKRVGLIDLSEPIDVVSIAKKMGFLVGNAILKDDMDGFIIIDESTEEILGLATDKLIGVNSERELEWKRFIVAHELAHFILDYSSENKNGFYAHRIHKKGKNAKENEADYFAASLLMPLELFKKRFNELKSKELSLNEMILLLADKFVVTQEMVRRRIEELELIQ